MTLNHASAPQQHIEDRKDTLVQNAVILAAGFGSRLASRSDSKPLATIKGMTLIEISVRQAIAAGVQKIVVVTGHKADEVEAELVRLSSSMDCTITPRRIDDWTKPNGWSVIAGASGLAGPFLLMMADHIFGDGVLDRLAMQSLTEEDAILATDRIDNPLVDPDDATWVALKKPSPTCGGRINKIGKDIADYDVVDCGGFLANANLPRAIESAIDAGKPGSLSDGMQALADLGRAATIDIDGGWWIDVDDPRAHDLADAHIADHLAIFALGQTLAAKDDRAA
ncbi:MAG: NTP transferase domain-containing protein [Erythrobacter sp.]